MAPDVAMSVSYERLLHSRGQRRLILVTPRGFILTNREWFVAVFDASYTQAV